MESLRLLDFSDRELLFVIYENLDDKGWAHSALLAEKLGLKTDKPAQCVGSRLSWLRRYGVVEHGGPNMWRLTPVGEVLMHGDLSREQQEQIKAVKPDQLIMLTRALTKRVQKARSEAGHLVRREWRFGTQT